MSDRPTEQLIAAMNSYTGAFADDRRFDDVLAALKKVRGDVERLDPVADRDLKNFPTRDTETDHRDGQPEAKPRLDNEERRHSKDEGQDDPPLKRAAKDARTLFRTARRQAEENRGEEATDDKGRK